MAWPATVSSGQIIASAKTNEIIAALALWGGNVSAGGYNLTNLAQLHGASNLIRLYTNALERLQIDGVGGIIVKTAGATLEMPGDATWKGRVRSAVQGNTIGVYASIGGSWDHNGSTIASIGDYDGNQPRAALGIYNQFNGSFGAQFRFLVDDGDEVTDLWAILVGGKFGIGKAAPGTALAVAGLPTYADNAAAAAGGLTAGDFYRTSTGQLMVVY
jgi:hypothetical protein